MSKCPACGADSTGKFCEYCGTPLEGGAATGAAAAATADAVAASEAAVAPEQYGTEQYVAEQPEADLATPVMEKTMDETDKKCPNCGGTVVYDPETQGMLCQFCGYKKELAPINEDDVVELDFKTAKNRSSCDWGAAKKTVVCKQCGAEAVYDALETAANCPFCGSTSVMPVEGIEDVMAPGGVVPFEISREKAADLFQKWLKGRLFAPSAAKKSCTAKNIEGFYLPYWTFDTQTNSQFTAELGFEYGSGDNKKIRWKRYSGNNDLFIDDHTVYASKKNTAAYIKSISTFNFKKIRPYQPELVAGFAAERYSVGLDDGWTIAQKGIKQEVQTDIKQKLKRQYHYDRIRNLNVATKYSNITFKYLLAPIWQANYKYNDKVYNVAINGQTGKVSGTAPISPWKVALAIAIVLGLIIFFMTWGS